jgi:hypothetical protein
MPQACHHAGNVTSDRIVAFLAYLLGLSIMLQGRTVAVRKEKREFAYQ